MMTDVTTLNISIAGTERAREQVSGLIDGLIQAAIEGQHLLEVKGIRAITKDFEEWRVLEATQ